MGTLHEHNRSLWVDDGIASRSDYPTLSGHLDADVVIVGGGLTGLLTAWCCQQDGARVVVVEAGALAAGATGYTTAKISSLHGLIYQELRARFGAEAAAAYARANQAGLGLIADLVDQLDIDCDFSRRPSFTYTEEPGDGGTIDAEVTAARDAGLPAAFTTITDLPWDVAAAVRVDDQAQFHPRRFCLGLAAAFVAEGGQLFEHSRVLGYRNGRPGTVELVSGTVTAERVVLATHLPVLDRGGFFARCTPTRSYCMSLTVQGSPPTGMYLASGQVSVDGLPFIGPLLPTSDTVLVGTAYRKWGMTNGAAAALVISDAISGRLNPWAELFSPSRLNLRHSAKPFVQANAEVAAHFVQDRVTALIHKRSAPLRSGQGRVRSHKGKLVAEYLDDDGVIHQVSPVCPHLGCHVTFNTAEVSWDCPCHGSRFDVDGQVLQGPAVRNLDPR
jgi:glycine/D-amino acid oxidase-like deaminating enzyme/nitrite reductase/ring-hydroxylating ferredoxin subunit